MNKYGKMLIISPFRIFIIYSKYKSYKYHSIRLLKLRYKCAIYEKYRNKIIFEIYIVISEATILIWEITIIISEITILIKLLTFLLFINKNLSTKSSYLNMRN